MCFLLGLFFEYILHTKNLVSWLDSYWESIKYVIKFLLFQELELLKVN